MRECKKQAVKYSGSQDNCNANASYSNLKFNIIFEIHDLFLVGEVLAVALCLFHFELNAKIDII